MLKLNSKKIRNSLPKLSLPELSRKQRIAGAVLLIVLLALYLGRGLFFVASVNGQGISRLELVRELEKQGAATTLNSLVTTALIKQEAKKQNVNISKEEIDQEISRIEESLTGQGQKLDDLLAARNMSRADLAEQIRVQKMVEKLLEPQLSITDEEVTKYLAANKDAFPKDASLEENRTTASEQLRQEKLSAAFQGWIAQLQEQAKINYFVDF